MMVSVTVHSRAHKKEENPTDQSLVLFSHALLIPQDELTNDTPIYCFLQAETDLRGMFTL